MVESTLAFIGGCDFDLYFAESVFGEDSCSCVPSAEIQRITARILPVRGVPPARP